MKSAVTPSPPTDADKIAERLRKARDHLQLSQADLAKRAGLSRSSVVHYEKGNAVPGAMELIKLANALGKTPNYLLGGDDGFFPSEKPEHFLASKSLTATIVRIALCLNAVDRDVVENISALLIGLVRQKLTAEEFAVLQETAAHLDSQLPDMLPDINKFAGQKAKAISTAKPKRSSRGRSSKEN